MIQRPFPTTDWKGTDCCVCGTKGMPAGQRPPEGWFVTMRPYLPDVSDPLRGFPRSKLGTRSFCEACYLANLELITAAEEAFAKCNRICGVMP